MYSLSLSLEREILEHVVDTSSICGGLSSFNDGFFDKKLIKSHSLDLPHVPIGV